VSDRGHDENDERDVVFFSSFVVSLTKVNVRIYESAIVVSELFLYFDYNVILHDNIDINVQITLS